MTRITPYNFEKYSIFDIQEHLKKLGVVTIIEFDECLDCYKLQVGGTGVSMEFPMGPEIRRGMRIIPCVRFEDYPRQANFEEDKKLYVRLGRKFHIKKGEHPHKMKDWDLIQETLKKL